MWKSERRLAAVFVAVLLGVAATVASGAMAHDDDGGAVAGALLEDRALLPAVADRAVEADAYGCQQICRQAGLTDPAGQDPDCPTCCLACCGDSATACTTWGWTPSSGCIGNVNLKTKGHFGQGGIVLDCQNVPSTEAPPVAGEVDCAQIYRPNDPQPQAFRTDGHPITMDGDVMIIEPEDGYVVIKSPGFPACDYYNNQKWTWSFKTTGNKRLKVEIVEARIENSPGCVRDSLRLYGMQLIRDVPYKDHCGQHARKAYWTVKSKGKVTFRSDDKGRRRGFHVRIRGSPLTWEEK